MATSPPPRRVLLLPTQPAALRTLRLAADALRADGRFAPEWLLAGRLADGHGEDALPVHRITTEADPVAAEGRLAAALRYTPPVVAARVRRLADALHAARAESGERLAALRPAALLTSDDRLSGAFAALLAEAGARGVPRITVPYALSRAEGSARTRRDRRVHHADVPPQLGRKRRIAREHAGQVHVADGRPLLFFSPEVTEALARAGALPARPWTMGGGLSDAVAVASAEDARYVASFGVDAARLHVVGDLSLDALHAAATRRDALRAELRARHFGGREGVLVIVAVPQLAEQGVAGEAAGRAAAVAFVRPFADAGAQVLCSLHPKCAPEDYAFLTREHGAALASRPLAELLPAADVFAAGFSSTVRWAVLCGVPTVVADLGWWGYDLYDHLRGVVTVRDAAALSAAASELVRDGARRAALAAAHAAAGAELPPFDGLAGARLVDLVARLAL